MAKTAYELHRERCEDCQRVDDAQNRMRGDGKRRCVAGAQLVREAVAAGKGDLK